VLTTVGLQEYNITAQRQIYDAFNARIAQYPELTREARVVHEGYSNKAVLAVDSASSAFPHRSDHHLLYVSTLLSRNTRYGLTTRAFIKIPRGRTYAGINPRERG
jgi:hypothetical protein